MIEALKTNPPATSPAQGTAHPHVHHDHAHHEHGHGHSHASLHHGHGGTQDQLTSRMASPRFSLLALSGSQRLLLIAAPITALWLLAFWALHNG